MIVLLLFKPGSLRDGLNALIYTIPDVKMVVYARDADAALEFCGKNPNTLIIMEIKPGDRALLGQVPEMKTMNPQRPVIALIYDENDRETAEKAGLDLIMGIGTRSPELKFNIEEVVRNFPEVDLDKKQRWLG